MKPLLISLIFLSTGCEILYGPERPKAEVEYRYRRTYLPDGTGCRFEVFIDKLFYQTIYYHHPYVELKDHREIFFRIVMDDMEKIPWVLQPIRENDLEEEHLRNSDGSCMLQYRIDVPYTSVPPTHKAVVARAN
jgi:hypothetical protein